MADLTFKEDAPIRGHRAKMVIYDDFILDKELLNEVLNKFIKGEENIDGSNCRYIQSASIHCGKRT